MFDTFKYKLVIKTDYCRNSLFYLVLWGSGNPAGLWNRRRRFDSAQDYSN